MAGIGDRMDAGSLTFDVDGFLIDKPGDPIPDDETLARLKKQSEEWERDVPQTVGAPARPLHWRRRTPED